MTFELFLLLEQAKSIMGATETLPRGSPLQTDMSEHHDTEPPDLPTAGSIPRDNNQADGSSEASDNVARRSISGVFWFILVVAIVSSTFLYALDNTVLANIRPSIVDTFGHIDLLPWVSVAYPLGELGSNPLWGKLNLHVNNKHLYLLTLFLFEVGTAVCATAQSINALIAGRVIAGFGGSGIYVSTITIVSALTSPKERSSYLNNVGIGWALGTFLGPVVGGAFADSSATWRWAFYINLVAAAVAAPAAILLVPSLMPPSADRDSGLWQRVKRVDYLGEILWLGGIGTIVAILSLGGTIYTWTGPQLIGLYVAAAVAWILFSLQQRFQLFTVDRIFPLELINISNLDMVYLFCWSAIAIASDTVTIYSLPLLYQFSFNYSSLHAALLTLPFILALIVAVVPAGPVFPKYPVYKYWFLIGGSLMLVAAGLMSTISFATSAGAISGYTVLQGIASGPVVQLPFTIGQAKVSKSEAGKVTAFLSCAQMAGLLLSLGIATTVFINGATNDIMSIVPDLPRDLIQGAINGVGSSLFDDLDPSDREKVLRAIARNVGKVFYLNVASAGFGVILALLMKRESVELQAVHEDDISL